MTLLQNTITKSLHECPELCSESFTRGASPSISYEEQKRPLLSRQKILAGSLAGIMVIIVLFWTMYSLVDHSDEIMALTASHQDGNDLFVVLHHERLRNLNPDGTVMIFNHIDDFREVLPNIDRTRSDLHLIVEDDHLQHIQDIAQTVLLKTVQILSLGSNNYHLLTTESHYGEKL